MNKKSRVGVVSVVGTGPSSLLNAMANELSRLNELERRVGSDLHPKLKKRRKELRLRELQRKAFQGEL